MTIEISEISGGQLSRASKAFAVTNTQLDHAKILCDKHFSSHSDILLAAIITSLSTNYLATVTAAKN